MKMNLNKKQCVINLLGISYCILASLTSAETLDLNVNNSTVQGLFTGHSFQRPELSYFAGLFHNEDDDQMVELGFFLSEPVEDERYYRPWAKIGIKALGFDTDFGPDGGAIAPGGVLSFYIPGFPGLYFDATGFFAPRVLSFGDGDAYTELTARLTYQIMTSADIYLGYRRIDISLDKVKDIKLDDAFHVGATFRF